MASNRTTVSPKLTAHEKYVHQVRAQRRHCSPYRLGLAVGAAGDNLPSPYTPGSRADHSYLNGIEYARVEKKINDKALELYQAATSNTPAWESLSGGTKWPWREKAIAALTHKGADDGR